MWKIWDFSLLILGGLGGVIVSSLSFSLCNENLNSFLTRWGNYSRSEEIWYFQIIGAMFHCLHNQLSNNRVEVHTLAHSLQCFTILIINYQTIGSKCIHWHRISNNSYQSFQTINQYLLFLQNWLTHILKIGGKNVFKC